jgi:hypothetical protein
MKRKKEITKLEARATDLILPSEEGKDQNRGGIATAERKSHVDLQSSKGKGF